MKSVFLGGFWTNVLNPKVALFFLAFVPQFIAPDAANKPLAFFLLGVLFNFNAIFVNVGWALLAGWTARRVGAVQRGMHWLERGAGALFVGFGIKLALSENPLAAAHVTLNTEGDTPCPSPPRKRCSAPSNTARCSTTRCCTSCASS